jgi:hypothetical protein
MNEEAEAMQGMGIPIGAIRQMLTRGINCECKMLGVLQRAAA